MYKAPQMHFSWVGSISTPHRGHSFSLNFSSGNDSSSFSFFRSFLPKSWVMEGESWCFGYNLLGREDSQIFLNNW